MSDLPDLDTSQISFIAYWNAIDDGGVSSIDPEDVIADGNINEYTLYDNGVHIDRYSIGPREIEARIKSDGWIIAYLDRTNNPATNTSPPPSGPWDIISDWETRSVNSGQNKLSRAIDGLQSEFTNASQITFSYSDVGLYNYEYPDATATTILQTSGNYPSGSFSYTASTTIKDAYTTAYIDSELDREATFEGVLVTKTGNYGVVDLLEQNLIASSGTTYNVDGRDGQLAVILVWSE